MRALAPLLVILLILLMAFAVKEWQDDRCPFRFGLRKEWIKKEVHEAAKAINRLKISGKTNR